MGVKRFDKQKQKQKQKQKKGLWSPDEDLKLKSYILNHGHTCWTSVAVNAGLQRNGKSCRLRWINYLRPGLKRGAFSVEEENTILTLHQLLGNKWSQMAHHLPGRTDNEIKNHWHSYLKKRVSKIDQTGKNKCVNNEQIQGSQLSLSSSVKSNPQDSSYESCENVESTGSNLPKVLFAEWLSLDQFHCQNSESSGNEMKHTLDFNNTNVKDSSVNGVQLNEGAFVGEMHTKSNNISADDDDEMFQLQFGFGDQSGLCHFFQGEFGMCCDQHMYI